jgi:uncharacterized repeat protein (TIGR01451 family)
MNMNAPSSVFGLKHKPWIWLLLSISVGIPLSRYWIQITVKGSNPDVRQSSPIPYLFKDIEPSTISSYPYSFIKFHDWIYFDANQSTAGFELWRSDGTITGTVLFMDVLPGNESAYPSYFVINDDTLYFIAYNASGEQRIWESDGTLTGTVQIPSTKTKCEVMTYCYGLVKMGDFLYFYGGDQVHGYELWRTDGTPTGTMMIKDIMPGSGNSYVANLTASEDKLYFFADDGLHGYELWRSDGTMNGTVLVKDIIPSIQPSVDIFPGTNIVIINDTIFFVAQDGYHGYELWKSDGTANGTFMVKDIFLGSNGSLPVSLTNYDGELFFSADDGVHGRELWKSDGSTFGTTLVIDSRPGSQGKRSLCYTCELGPVHRGYLYFEVNSDTALQLWRTDGTTAGTTLVMDLAPETSSFGATVSSQLNMNNLLYINRYLSDHLELWISDGTYSSTLAVANIYPYFPIKYREKYFINDKYFFSAWSRDSGNQLWAIPVTTHSDLYLSLRSQTVLEPDGPVTYTITFENTGITRANQVVVTDTLSSALNSINSASSGASITLTATAPYRWEIADLDPGDGGTITITGIVNSSAYSGDLILNLAEFSAQMSDGLLVKRTRGKESIVIVVHPVYLPTILNFIDLVNLMGR